MDDLIDVSPQSSARGSCWKLNHVLFFYAFLMPSLLNKDGPSVVLLIFDVNDLDFTNFTHHLPISACLVSQLCILNNRSGRSMAQLRIHHIMEDLTQMHSAKRMGDQAIFDSPFVSEWFIGLLN